MCFVYNWINSHLDKITDIFTIIGVIFAVFIYFLWKKDYRSQKANEYSLQMLAMIKKLHLDIELLRSPKFSNNESIINDIDNFYIPKIEERIGIKLIDIKAELLIAEKFLVYNTNLQSKFNENIINKIINKINTAIYTYKFEKNRYGFEINETELYKIIFPCNSREVTPNMIIRSNLGTGMEVINDEFNIEIEAMFNSIYDDLGRNIIK